MPLLSLLERERERKRERAAAAMQLARSALCSLSKVMLMGGTRWLERSASGHCCAAGYHPFWMTAAAAATAACGGGGGGGVGIRELAAALITRSSSGSLT